MNRMWSCGFSTVCVGYTVLLIFAKIPISSLGPQLILLLVDGKIGYFHPHSTLKPFSPFLPFSFTPFTLSPHPNSSLFFLAPKPPQTLLPFRSPTSF